MITHSKHASRCVQDAAQPHRVPEKPQRPRSAALQARRCVRAQAAAHDILTPNAVS